jgi:hypothetical protein
MGFRPHIYDNFCLVSMSSDPLHAGPLDAVCNYGTTQFANQAATALKCEEMQNVN